jgi:5-methylcytosine-specific restriction endonuclease McrA
MRLRVPEVIALSNYDRQPASAVTFSRRNVFKWDRYVCQYCGSQPGVDELTLDHVVPTARRARPA